MKKLFYILVLVVTIIACSPVSWTQIGNGEVMKNEFENVYSKSQFDSICKEDGLPSDLSLWLSNHMRDYETKKAMYRYMYIKRMDSLEVIYILDKDAEKYNLSKRVTEQ